MAKIANEYYKILFEREDLGQFESVTSFEVSKESLVKGHAKKIKELLPDWYVHIVRYKAEHESSENWEEVL